jgi:hypothetical protein
MSECRDNLVKAIDDLAKKLEDGQLGDLERQDASECLRALNGIILGKDVSEVFGDPSRWSYEGQISEALIVCINHYEWKLPIHIGQIKTSLR